MAGVQHNLTSVSVCVHSARPNVSVWQEGDKMRGTLEWLYKHPMPTNPSDGPESYTIFICDMKAEPGASTSYTHSVVYAMPHALVFHHLVQLTMSNCGTAALVS